MVNAASPPFIAYHDYIRNDQTSELKHELDGSVVAKGQKCRLFSADVRIRIKATGLATYSDLSVVYGSLQVDLDDENSVANPSVIIEVLSLSTKSYDRSKKFAHYIAQLAAQKVKDFISDPNQHLRSNTVEH
jgi:Uma2 family endonuclease